MADQDGRAAGGQLAEVLEHGGLRFGVQGAGRFVEDENLGAAQESPGESHLLPLADAELRAAAELRAQHGFVALGKRGQGVVRARAEGRRCDSRVVGRQARVAHPDVLPGRHVVAGVVLKNDADFPAQRRAVEAAQIDAVERDGAGRRVVEAAQQFHQGGLPRPVLPDQRNDLPGPNGQADVMEHHFRARRVAEPHPVEHDPLFHGPGNGSRGVPNGERGLQVEEVVEVGKKKIVLEKAGQPAQHLFQVSLAPLKRLVVHHQVAHGHGPLQGAVGDEGECAVDGEGGARLGRQLAQGAFERDADFLLPELPAQLAGALHQQGAQIEQAHFLGVAFTGEQPVQINRRPFRFRPSQLPAVEPVCEFQAHQGPGDRGRKQDHGNPPVAGNHQRRDPGQYHEVLRDLDEARHHAQRPVGGFLLGAVKGVAKTGILVVLQVQRHGFGMEQILNVIAHGLGLRLAYQPGDRGEKISGEHGRPHETDPHQHPVDGGGLVRGQKAGGHRIQREFHEIELQQRQAGLQAEQRSVGKGPAGGGFPHQGEHSFELQVAQG